ncbi:MAG: site-specific recombinase XerD [Halopseudomonas sp.]|jgi:site-specific recombinase XerD|uniref:Tyrosine-type recombinase/integrase n=2 Tax=Halioxenophilus aromaticivorans TaxID=1306992 RepID=A0AAV3U7V4_9ALTE|nr:MULTISPECIES: tyrosine-type recombinase/integrase [Haliea]|tara:strand:- start:20693 stop:21874 length:1182 start_codon:yes stop_codon:yes gene_type:complete
MEYIDNASPPDDLSEAQSRDFTIAVQFLQQYTGSAATFNSYRREVENLLQWTWHIALTTLDGLKREDIEKFIRFSQRPPAAWIGVKKAPRFIDSESERRPNPEWRPFVATVSKSAHKKGEAPSKKDYFASNNSIKQLMAICSSFYQYLLLEEYVYSNPVALIRQKSKFVQKRQGQTRVRRLSPLQWQVVITTAEQMAADNPGSHERTLFMLSALYSMYLRISELAASDRWTPTMNDFHKDNDGLWWFTTVGKGNKERQIAVSDTMLAALKRWRKFRGLSVLPTPADDSPLLPVHRGQGPMANTTHIRSIVQDCFDKAIQSLVAQQQTEEAESLMGATVHWLRHTGISEDVKTRPREHVRDDAGHSSSAITDKYIDIELKERHKSAKKKRIHSL